MFFSLSYRQKLRKKKDIQNAFSSKMIEYYFIQQKLSF